MKNATMIISVVFLAMASLATPAGIVYAIYSWAVQDVQIQVALWQGVKLWLQLLASGLIIGLPLYIYSVK